MLSLFRWSFNAVFVGNRIQSSMAGPRATPSKGNYPYLQVTARRMQSCTKVVPNFLRCYPCGVCGGFDRSPTRRSAPPTSAGDRSRNHPATGIKRRPKKSRPRVRIHLAPPASLQVSGFSHQLREKRAFGRNPAPKVHRRTGLVGFKREFWRILSVCTFGGELSL
jgi:hypothetical protein